LLPPPPPLRRFEYHCDWHRVTQRVRLQPFLDLNTAEAPHVTNSLAGRRPRMFVARIGQARLHLASCAAQCFKRNSPLMSAGQDAPRPTRRQSVARARRGIVQAGKSCSLHFTVGARQEEPAASKCWSRGRSQRWRSSG
jgi:hypothetical protein